MGANEESDKRKNAVRARIKTIANLAGIAAFVLSLVNLAFLVHPEWKPGNRNHLEMANAGTIESELFLAQSYFEIGDYSQSCYWYKILAMEEIENKGRIYNNLAYLYMVYSQQEEPLMNYKDIALELFIKAGDAGEAVAYRNAYIVLLSNPIDSFTNYDPAECIEKKKELKELIEQTGVYDHNLLCTYDVEWEHPTSFQTYEPVEVTETDNEKTVLISTSTALFGKTLYTYKHYVRKTSKMGDYEYINLNDMNPDNEGESD